ncbi:conserved oligomeric Golgi complex subunit 7 [Hevea brasiliensis]|uniref:conserved oligomeric Golgi complex subunit 7 n=1 Tax=Hevea brasiliensis TaxID=3981 RepID=UPI0025F75215|nr:conserved oligomeric Golgi complex subunit 7 [Hevea brasiliensis]
MHYTKVHLKPIKQLWEDFDSRQRARKLAGEKNELESLSVNSDLPTILFSSWLPSFHDELLLYLEQEWKCCMVAFPSDYKILVPKLLIETMQAIGPSFVSGINLATGDVVPETKVLAKGILDILSGDMPKGIKIQTKHLEALIELHNMTGSFARNSQHLFSESDLRVLLDTMKAVYLPYESFKQRYGRMERAILSSEIAEVDLRGAVTHGVGAQGIELSETVRRMEESIPQVTVLLEAAVERCINITGGSEADELILALDDIMLQYISFLQETLKSLRAVCGVDNVSDPRKDMILEKKEGSQNIRKIVFEASLRATLARLSTSLSLSLFGSSLDQNQSQIAAHDGNKEPYLGGRAALDVAAVRLVDAPEKARKLFNLLEQAHDFSIPSKDPRFHAPPLASQRVAAFSDTVNELVYDALISKVRQRLSGVSRLPIWSSIEEQSAFPLPTFSAYPQSYVTSVGEYLFTLPQQLEPLAEGISNSDVNNDEAQFFATEWMFKVAEGATAVYMEQLRGIQHITDRGAQQLSVDIEYLSNVLSALSMPIPPILATFHTCLSTPRKQLKHLVKSDAGNQLDLPTANLVCKIPRISLD